MKNDNLVQTKQTTNVDKNSKNDFIIRMVCLTFCGGMLIVHLIFITLMSIYHKFETNLTTTMAGPSLPAISLGLLLWALPFFMHFFLRKFIGIYVIIPYIVFLFLSHFMGTVLDVYDIRFIAGMQNSNWWDKVMHTTFGYLAAIIGLFLLCHITRIKKLNATTVILFCIGFSALTAVFWEICEFTADQLLGESCQGDWITGGQFVSGPNKGETAQKFISVNDTMGDIIVHMIGTLVFTVQYILHATTKKSFFLTGMKEEFSKNCFVKDKEQANFATVGNSVADSQIVTSQTIQENPNTDNTTTS